MVRRAVSSGWRLCCGMFLALGGLAHGQQEIGPLVTGSEGPRPATIRVLGYQGPQTLGNATGSPSDEPGGPDSPFKPIGRVSLDIVSPLEGARPESETIGSEPEGIAVTTVLARPWPTMSYSWVAAGTRHNPLYFEEVNAERYGTTCSPCLQPAISTAHFFGTIPALPYLMGADCPWECQYTLGHYRPGSCNPWRPHYWPVSARGALCQAGVVTGIVFLP